MNYFVEGFIQFDDGVTFAGTWGRGIGFDPEAGFDVDLMVALQLQLLFVFGFADVPGGRGRRCYRRSASRASNVAAPATSPASAAWGGAVMMNTSTSFCIRLR
ncbi:MAG: hypothetical protein ACRYF5_16600 [Janthinobacterium lividum]